MLAELVPSGGCRRRACAAATPGTPRAWTSARATSPPDLQDIVAGGEAGDRADRRPRRARRWSSACRCPPRASSSTSVGPLTELRQVLRTLSAVLVAGAVAATAAGAAFGVWASRRAVQPLEQVAGAATRIAGGELATRLPADRRPRPGRHRRRLQQHGRRAVGPDRARRPVRRRRQPRAAQPADHAWSPASRCSARRRDGAVAARRRRPSRMVEGELAPVPPDARRPAAAGPPRRRRDRRAAACRCP